MNAKYSLLALTVMFFNIEGAVAQEVIWLKCDLFGTMHSYSSVHGSRRGPDIKSSDGSDIFVWDASKNRVSHYYKDRQIIQHETGETTEISEHNIIMRYYKQSSAGNNTTTTSYYYLIDRVSLAAHLRSEARINMGDGMEVETELARQGKCQIIPPQPVQRRRI